MTVSLHNSLIHRFGGNGLINFIMRANIEENDYLLVRIRVLLDSKHNPTIVSAGTGL
jgi:hypothetical protein